MVTIFIVVANEALMCVGIRWCEPFSAVELTRMWQLGAIEVMGEGLLGGVAVKVWRRVKDKFPKTMRTDRLDKDLSNER
jgi:hypothetical protein